MFFGNTTMANVDGAIEKLISRIDTKVWNGALDNLDNSQKREIKQDLKRVLGILQGRSLTKISCMASSSNNRKYRFHNGRDEFGGNFTFLSSCKDLLQTEHRGLICGKSPRSSRFQIYRTRNGQPIAGKITFESDCKEALSSMNQAGLFCAKGPNGRFQVFNSRTGGTVGGEHTFESDCLEML